MAPKKTNPEQAPEIDQPDLAVENAAPKAELEAMKAKMNEPVNAGAAAPVAEEKVDVFVPRGYANDEPNLLIAVNGVNYLLPRGKTSKVPKHVAKEFMRSQKAQADMDDRVSQMLEASK